jgi:hypothetical protein
MSGVKLQRTLDQWRNCDPKMMVNAQSPAAIQFAIADAKRDIYALAAANQRLEGEVAALRQDAELIQILKFARATMAVTAKSESLREVERRSLLDEVARIDAKLAEMQSCSPAE